MRSFTDANGNTWNVVVDWDTTEDAQKQSGIDLLEGSFSEILMRLGSDMRLLAKVLYGLCLKQAGQKNISYEVFRSGLKGEVWENAFTAFEQECLDFFPPSRLAAYRAAKAREAEIKDATTQMVNNDIDKLINLAASGSKHGKSADVSESTSENSPSVS